MLLFYQRGDILHFSRSFSIFRQGSCLISLYPIFPPLFPRTFALLLSPFPLFNPRFLNFVRCSRVFATPHFPNTRKRYISIIRCNRQLEYSQPGSSTGALQKLYGSSATASVIQLLRRSMIVMQSLQPIYYSLISRQKEILFNSAPLHSTPLHSTPQHYRLLLHYAYSPLHK